MAVRFAEAATSAYRFPLLIRHLLHGSFEFAANQQIVYRDSRIYTYATLSHRIACLATALTRLGIESGDTVAIMDWDSHRYLECYFAIPMMGAILQTVNVRLSAEQVLYTINHARAKLLLVHHDFVPLLDVMRERLSTVKAAVILEGSANDKDSAPLFSGEYEELITNTDEPFEFTDFDENATATTFYTTGTTGSPKAVSFSHRQIVLHTLAVLGALASAPDDQSFRRDDIYMPLTPMFHVHAWGIPYVATALGVRQVYPGRYVPSELIKLRARERVTYSHCVPTVLQMLLDEPAAESTDMRGWKITIGGSALSAGLAQRAKSRGIQVFAAYGMSETCPVLTVARYGQEDEPSTGSHPKSLRKAGVPIPLVELRVVDTEMREVPHDGHSCGEIVVRSPWLTTAYQGEPEASRLLWHGGYLHTQDVGSISQDGSLEIRDRMKDVIKSGGEWISSIQVEDLISQHPGVAETAVIGVPDAMWGERPVALVVVKQDWHGRLTVTQILDHLKNFAQEGVIPRYAIPARIVFVDVLQRTSVGKLDKKRIREEFDNA